MDGRRSGNTIIYEGRWKGRRVKLKTWSREEIGMGGRGRRGGG